jgi:uncharacterized protein
MEGIFMRHECFRVAMVLLAVLGLALPLTVSAGQTRPADSRSVEMEGHEEVDDYYVVDCLLPGEVRRMGRATYLSPRIPTRTTALDCRIRGGEYVSYHRADYRSALNVWLARAEAGDAEAQHYVGEIHEKGLGREPDLVEAARWYRRAAEQGYTRAMVNLAYFHEQGLGVEQDMAAALNWYRRATGASEDDLVFASAARAQIESLEAELAESLERARAEQRVLSQQVDSLRQQLAERESAREGDQDTIATLERMLADASSRVDQTEGRLLRLRGSAADLPGAPDAAEAPLPAVVSGDMEFGRYYALIVGLEGYHHWERLESPHQDARRLAEVLSERYGFDTTLLLDASKNQMMAAVDELRKRVSRNDNVLIYFAGHGQFLRPGELDERRGFGYWLPVNAELSGTTYWIPNSAVSELMALAAARSVLVVADSCYGGAMSTDPGSMLVGSGTAVSEGLVRLGLSRQARFVLSSGGLSPVFDRISGEHSVFARALIEVLESNQGILREQDVYRQVSERVGRLTEPLGVEQVPELRPIRQAGHEAGSFFFVPTDSS